MKQNRNIKLNLHLNISHVHERETLRLDELHDPVHDISGDAQKDEARDITEQNVD